MSGFLSEVLFISVFILLYFHFTTFPSGTIVVRITVSLRMIQWAI